MLVDEPLDLRGPFRILGCSAQEHGMTGGFPDVELGLYASGP